MHEAVEKILSYEINREEKYLESLDFKLRYSPTDYLSKNSQGIGFIVNNLVFIAVSIPFIAAFQLSCSLIFWLAFRYPLSKFFRRFSFFGLTLVCFCEGNVEQFSF